MAGTDPGASPSDHVGHPPGEFNPVRAEERILILDVLRGFAMFGVLWSNLNDWYGTTDAISGFQHALEFFQNWLIESRFYYLLGFLFGMGFAIQLTRAEERGVDVRVMFMRRMAVLLGIGILHGTLIWRGDVLTQYALLGMLLLFFRRLSPRALLAAAAATLFLLPYLINIAIAATGLKFPARLPDDQINWIYMHGTFTQIVSRGALDYLFWYRRWPLFVFPAFVTLFVLGLWAVRVDLVKRLMARRSRLLWVLVAAVAGTLIGAYVQTNLGKWWPPPKSPPTLGEVAFSLRALRLTIAQTAWHLFAWSNTVVYAAALALLVSVPAGARLLAPLAAVGRMSLTTYLTQSLVSVTLFYHYGFGWYGRVGHGGMLTLTVTLFALQMAASVWWLGRYRFGPMEWLWRSAAYGRLQPMHRKTERPVAVPSTADRL